MSKSEKSERSRINISDDADTIQTKILRAKTDCIMGVTYNETERPEVANLVRIYSALSARSIEDICKQYAHTDLQHFKRGLIEVVVGVICPIGKKLAELQKDKAYIETVLNQGANNAQEIAYKNMREIKDLVGLV